MFDTVSQSNIAECELFLTLLLPVVVDDFGIVLTPQSHLKELVNSLDLISAESKIGMDNSCTLSVCYC